MKPAETVNMPYVRVGRVDRPVVVPQGVSNLSPALAFKRQRI
jgi:hypothetical protein